MMYLQNEEMHAEGELRNNLDDSEKVRELQDKVAELNAEVREIEAFSFHTISLLPQKQYRRILQ